MRRHEQPQPPPFEPAEADIQHHAYLLWREAGCPAGRDLDLWLAAKERLRHRPAPEPGPDSAARKKPPGRGHPAR